MPGWTPKWVLTPRADDSAGPVSPVSRWSTIAPSVGIQRSCDRWQLAERCPGHSQPCPCSMCAQASGCPHKWTAPGCPSSWTSTEGPHRWVRLGSASLFSGSKVASVSRLGQVRGRMGKGTQTCLPLRGSGGGCSAVPGVWAPVPSTWTQRVRVGKAGEPGPGPRRPPLSLLFAAPVPTLASSSLLSPLTEQPRPMATSFLLTPAPVPVDPRLGISREMRMGWDGMRVSGIRSPRIKPAVLLICCCTFLSAASFPALIASTSLSALGEPFEGARSCRLALWTLGTWPYLKLSESKSEGPAYAALML